MTRTSAEVGSAANSYEILAKLAMGGMAEIFLARGASAAGVERYVVLKRVLRHRADDAHFVDMFLDEARLAAQLQHPNIAQVYDIGKLGNSYFFTMEYVHGETVRTLLGRSHGLRQPIPIGAVLSIVAGAASGLHHAHERKGVDGRHLGIVHRDVSPSNLMVSYEGTVKVVDFGVAKAAHRSTETQSGTVKGKITYMSPEQCKGTEIDRRSDLFALGIVFWELLTSEKLFRRHSDFETMQAIVMEDVPPPSQLRADVSPEIDRIVLRLLAKDPAQRYQTGDELHEAIEEAAVRTGSVLSPASLGRYMRELFGQRPEPWIELQTLEAHPEAVTVTSEPIATSLASSTSDDFERKLSAVPALTQRLVVAAGPHEQLRTEPNHESGPVFAPHASGPVRQLHESGSLPPQNLVPLPVGMRAHRPSMTPSEPSYPVLSSASHHTYPGIPYPVVQRQPERRRSRALYFFLPAIVIGVVIGIAFGVGGSERTAPPIPQRAPLAASVGSASEQSPVVPMQSVVSTAPATTAAPAGPPGSAATPPTDRATSPTGDRASGATGASDVGAPDIEMASDDGASDVEMASEDGASDVEVAKGDRASATESTGGEGAARSTSSGATSDATAASDDGASASSSARPPDVEALFHAGRYREAVATCAASRTVLARNAVACTLAACKVKQAARAKRWFARVASAHKAATARQCDGIALADRPDRPAKPDRPTRPATDDICKRDMMACQH